MWLSLLGSEAFVNPVPAIQGPGVSLNWSEACAGYIDPRLYLCVTFWGQWNRISCSNSASACAAANQAGADALDRPWRSKINEDQAGYLNAKPSIAGQSG